MGAGPADGPRAPEAANPLPDLPIQYSDYAHWQRERLRGPRLARLLGYWRSRLAGSPPLLDLPTDHPRPTAQTYRGARQTFDLPPDLLEGLARLAQDEGATPFMACLAAFAVLLGRYSGQEDICIGAPVASRARVETEPLIGFFANTLVFRVDLSGKPTFRELLRRTRRAALDDYAHAEMPFEKLVEELRPERSLAHNPLFQVMLAYQNVPVHPLTLPGLQANPIAVDAGVSRFDLSLYLYVHGDGGHGDGGHGGGAAEGEARPRGLVEFSLELFDPATIARLIGHLLTLLQVAVADPDRSIARLDYLTPPERRKLLVEWNDTAADYPADRCIHELFAAQAARTPDAVAVRVAGFDLTYRELDARANRLAHHLRRLGVGPEAIVGVYLERSPELVVALLGILKAGGAYLPLDPAYPADRLGFVLEDAAPPVVVTSAELQGRLPPSPARLVRLDADWPEIAPLPGAAPASAVTPEGAAYVIYTSGSTGRPKGVVGLHRGAVNRFAWMWRTYPFAAGEVCCQKTAPSFVDSVWELFGPLLAGVPTVIVSPEAARDPRSLARELAAHRVSRIVLVPSLLRALLDAHPDLGERLPTLRFWVSSGEALPLELAQRFARAVPGATLLNLYGSSEVAADVTCFDLRGLGDGHATVPLGRPIANTAVYVLDRGGELAPVGVPGDVHVGGAGLARGYLRRPELTAERFVPNPFADGPGARLYRTGDLARWLPDGNLEFLGRADHQVKVRGFRVELGEVEAALARHPAIREAVVVAREDAQGDRRLVAYVVPADGVAPDAGDLRAYLARLLPEHMVPATVAALDQLPLTPSGKVDRRALPPPGEARPAGGAAFVAPRDELERRLAALWEDLLGVRPVGATDSFFSLGGHSLLAARLIARIGEELGQEVPLAVVFQAPTLERLADALRPERPAISELALVPVQPGGSRPPLFGAHLIGGFVVYHDLSRHLGQEQPVYGLLARGLGGEAPAPASVEEMAAQYVADIRALQPAGPYYLCGYSAGGVWAYEVARQLRARGESVALLALFDSACPGYYEAWPAGAKLGYIARTFAALSRAEQVEHVYTHWCRFKGGVKEGVKALARRCLQRLGALPRPAPPPGPPPDEQLKELHRQALRRYRPLPYPGRITFFRARDARPPEGEPGRLPRPDSRPGWRALARGGLEVVELPGDHGLIGEPHVGLLAERLRERLAAAPPDGEAREGSGPTTEPDGSASRAAPPGSRR